MHQQNKWLRRMDRNDLQDNRLLNNRLLNLHKHLIESLSHLPLPYSVTVL